MTTTDNTSIALCILVFCFESCCFATIFTLGLRGLGRHSKRGGSFLVSAISVGCVFPPMMGAVVTARDAHVAMAIPMMGYALTYVFPVYVNFFNRGTMDTRRATTLNTATALTDKELELERNVSNDAGDKHAVEIVEQSAKME